MHSTRVSFTGAIIIGLLFSILCVPGVRSTPLTIYVDDSNTTAPFEGTQTDPYPTIGAALLKAQNGDTIYVYAGYYRESLTIDRSITLQGEQRDTTIIDGQGLVNQVVLVAASNVSISGFTITNSTRYGIQIQQSDITISSCKLYSQTGGGAGLLIGINTREQVNNLLIENTIFQRCSTNGLILYHTTRAQILGNTFLNNLGPGIALDNAAGSLIQGNVFTSNIGYGIELSNQATNNRILENSFQENHGGISLIQASNANLMYHNDFLSNDQNANDGGTNTWYDTSSNTGNYWFDYTGVDTNGNGIGETAYPVPGGSSTDPFPYVLENGWNQQLELHVPTTTAEYSLFTVEVTVNEQPLSLVTILFNEESYLTDASGTVELRAPNVTSNTVFEITALKSGYINGTSTITILNTTTETVPLLIIAPSSVVEGTEFTVTIMANNQPVDNVTVLFVSIRYFSDRNGQCRLIAPLVDQDTSFVIDCGKLGYEIDEKTILVRNNGHVPADGTLHGYITTSDDEPLQNVYIIVQSVEHHYDTFTDTYGYFTLTLPVGTYTLIASKLNYNTGTNQQILIEENTIAETSLILTPLEAATSSTYLSYALETTLNQAIATGDMLATVNVVVDTPASIATYATAFEMTLVSQTSTAVTLTLDGTMQHNGKLIAILIGPGAFEDLKNVTIIYDNVTLTPLPFDTFFTTNITERTAPLVTTLVASNAQGQSTIYCLLKIPHFSTHTLTIMGMPFTPAQIQQLSWFAIIGAIIITMVAAVLVYRRGKEF